MTTLEVLVRARALIARPFGWTKDTFARDRLFRRVSYTSPHATSFCLWGAAFRAASGSSVPCGAWQTALLRAMDAPPDSDVLTLAAWNDTPGRRKREVLALLDKAIATERAKLEGE